MVGEAVVALAVQPREEGQLAASTGAEAAIEEALASLLAAKIRMPEGHTATMVQVEPVEQEQAGMLALVEEPAEAARRTVESIPQVEVLAAAVVEPDIASAVQVPAEPVANHKEAHPKMIAGLTE